MSIPISIRPIADPDVERLDRDFPEPGAPESRHGARWDLQRRQEGVYLIAWRSGRPIGWVFVHRVGSSQASECAGRLEAAEIEDLYVDPPFRGQGYGSALLTHAERIARSEGWSRVGLEVTVSNRHNDVARAMYERHGYVDAGLGEFESGYFYWTADGERHWDGEPHRYLVKSLMS